MQGAAGEWSAFSLQWERRREGCVLNTASLSIVLIDGRGLAYTVGSQRGGIPLTYRDKRGTVDMPFRVPEKVPLGTATLLVSAPFQCGRWPTESARARYSFEVVHRDE